MVGPCKKSGERDHSHNQRGTRTVVSVDQNKDIARRAFASLMNGDLHALNEVLSPDAVLHQCGFLEPIPARAILRGEFPGAGRVQDRDIQLERIIGEGDLVALHWRTSGRFSNPDKPEIDGRHVSFPSMSFIRFEGGAIAEIWNIQDIATRQSQLDEASENA
jgi:ketosteroid isomerase-like protein